MSDEEAGRAQVTLPWWPHPHTLCDRCGQVRLLRPCPLAVLPRRLWNSKPGEKELTAATHAPCAVARDSTPAAPTGKGMAEKVVGRREDTSKGGQRGSGAAGPPR